MPHCMAGQSNQYQCCKGSEVGKKGDAIYTKSQVRGEGEMVHQVVHRPGKI
jgi:hypothetical protein